MSKAPLDEAAVEPISSWGRLSRLPHHVRPLRNRIDADLGNITARPALPFGNGRSYGDACLNPNGTLWTTRGLDRFIGFDVTTGVIECEAGVLFADILEVCVPRGWFLPATPGTRFVTVGGAIANDVHGKNHHVAGTFGAHVEALTLLRSDGSRLVCSRDENADLLAATIGGLGLTGVILSARFRLKRVPGPWMSTQSIAFTELRGFFELSRDSERDWEYAVSWIDCTRGEPTRGIFFRANHVAYDAPAPKIRGRTVPLTPPLSLINRITLHAFNAAYFARHRAASGTRCQHYVPYFYPLDGLLEWNRIYGPSGFYQYQCVVPRETESSAVAALLNAIAKSGRGSFLAVLKTFGSVPAAGMLSFPMAGTTLALDFPNEGERTAHLFRSLDAIVRDAGGRLYAAKDARMPADLFLSGYPRLEEFKRHKDPGLSSALWRRLVQD